MSSNLLESYRMVLAQIESATKAVGRPVAGVKLIAVSKVQPYESIRTLYEAGHRDFGENYVQELVEKAERAKADGLLEIRWHFIGHLQTNKVKILLPHVTMIHGIGSLKLAQEISKRSDSRKISGLIG